MMVAADTGTFAALPLPYYVRYCWVEPDGTESNYESTIFPSVQTFPPQESGASAPSGGAAISRMLLVRPVTDQALFPKVEAAKNADFSDARLLDPRAVPADLDCFKVFDGSVWGDFPAEGLGTPFDNMSVAVEMSRFASFGETCFVRYCWIAADGTETDWKSTLFPVSATPPNAVAAGPAGGGKISGKRYGQRDDFQYRERGKARCGGLGRLAGFGGRLSGGECPAGLFCGLRQHGKAYNSASV